MMKALKILWSVGTAVPSLLTGPYGLLIKWGVIAALASSFAAFFWIKGDEHGTQKLVDYVGRQATESVRIARGRDVVTERVVTEFVKVQGRTRTVTETIEKEVIKYANASDCLDAEWRRLHDNAALDAVPDAGRKADGEGGAPTAAAALGTVTKNYAGCNRTADRLDALQTWVRQQQAVK